MDPRTDRFVGWGVPFAASPAPQCAYGRPRRFTPVRYVGTGPSFVVTPRGFCANRSSVGPDIRVAEIHRSMVEQGAHAAGGVGTGTGGGAIRWNGRDETAACAPGAFHPGTGRVKFSERIGLPRPVGAPCHFARRRKRERRRAVGHVVPDRRTNRGRRGSRATNLASSASRGRPGSTTATAPIAPRGLRDRVRWGNPGGPCRLGRAKQAMSVVVVRLEGHAVQLPVGASRQAYRPAGRATSRLTSARPKTTMEI